MGTLLTPADVERIFLDSLLTNDDSLKDFILAQGLVRQIRFHPKRLMAHKEEICALLAELPDDFRCSVGGGSSFTGLPWDRHGKRWTEIHQNVEQLFVLGNAIGRMSYVLPFDMGKGFPHVVFDDHDRSD